MQKRRKGRGESLTETPLRNQTANKMLWSQAKWTKLIVRKGVRGEGEKILHLIKNHRHKRVQLLKWNHGESWGSHPQKQMARKGGLEHLRFLPEWPKENREGLGGGKKYG